MADKDEIRERSKENVREAIRTYANSGKIGEVPEKYFAAFKDEVEAARSDYKQAAKDFEGNLSNQEARLSEKVRKLKEEYAEKVETANKKSVEMAQAVASGDDKKADDCEREIDSLNAESFTIEKKIKTLETTRATGDKDLYIKTEETYGCYVALLDAVRAGIEEYESILKDTIEALELNARNASELKRHFSDPEPGSYETTERVRFYESIFGFIDVRGHHAGTDENAKARFICGNIRGIEDTAAGIKLAERLGIDLSAIDTGIEEPKKHIAYRNPERMASTGFDPEKQNRKWKGIDEAPGKHTIKEEKK